jgi:gamma-glutamyltranspeptidase/glutathione hydrolase
VAVVAGFGAGGRVFDGRAAQPGKGAARPRGFVDDASIPDGARVAVPRTIPMLMLLSGHKGRATLSELARAGIAAAESAGKKERARLIRRIGAAGVLALRAAEVERALLEAGGPVAGGALSAADIEAATPAEGEAIATAIAEGTTAYTPPFPPPESDSGDAEVIVACDARGTIAALAYAPARRGVTVPGLEVTLGLHAVPVRRGVTRLAPGTVLPGPAPLVVAVQPGVFAAAVGVAGRASIDPLSAVGLAGGAAVERALADLKDRQGGRHVVAVVTDGKAARAARVE